MKLMGQYNCRTLLLQIFCCFLYHCIEANRNLTLHINPYCEHYSICDDIKNDLVYVEAVGSNDTLHYLWSMQGVPSSLIVHTDLTSTLKVNWTNLLSDSTNDSITFSKQPLYSFGVLISKLWQYNDTKDNANMTEYDAQGFDFSGVEWKTENHTYNSSNECSVTFSSEQNCSSGFLSEGTFSLKLSSYGNSGRGDSLPHLLHSSDTSQIRIILDKLFVMNETSRYALEFMIMYSINESEKIVEKRRTTLDDEYTPGVFTAVELKTPSICNSDNDFNGFLFWKPIAYIHPQFTVAHSTDVKLYGIKENRTLALPFSIVQAFFGNQHFVSKASWNISLGMSNDNFYSKTHYTSWSLTIGLGMPPEDIPSLLLILTIGIGFGAPFVFMLGGGAYMGFRRFLRKEDDLLLSRDSM